MLVGEEGRKEREKGGGKGEERGEEEGEGERENMCYVVYLCMYLDTCSVTYM